MGFGAKLHIAISIDEASGRPYVWKKTGPEYDDCSEKVFDMSQLPTIPEEFKEFIKLSGWEWTAYMPSVMDGEDEWTLTSGIPFYEEVCEDEHMMSDDGPYHSKEDYNKFKAFLEWAENTGFDYCYQTWA
jgi:hypothetical protein